MSFPMTEVIVIRELQIEKNSDSGESDPPTCEINGQSSKLSLHEILSNYLPRYRIASHQQSSSPDTEDHYSVRTSTILLALNH